MGQVSKLNYINNKLGSSAAQGQQTTRIIYDTDVQTTAAVGTPATKYYEFFTTGANKTLIQTNLNTGKLDSMESMVIKELHLYSTTANGSVSWNYNGFAKGAIVNIYIGNQCVLKNFNIGTQWGASFGPVERFFYWDNSIVHAGIRFLTDIVIPPQTDIKVTLQYGPSFQVRSTGSVGTSATHYMQCKLIGYGTLFNAGTSF